MTVTDVNELHQHRLQVTEGGSGLHTETQLLLKVTAKRHLRNKMSAVFYCIHFYIILGLAVDCWNTDVK